ncbi:MAG: hypothetical protein INF91_05615 [Alphaproteobacteria bacterium]|nr:hypothetical protein [Alphaproteobacteria bacterium]
MTISTKAPGQTPLVSFDWAERLADGETIASAAWAVVPSGELAAADPSESDTTTTAKLTGGLAGKTYEVRCTITKSNGLTDVLSTTVKILTSEAV